MAETNLVAHGSEIHCILVVVFCIHSELSRTRRTAMSRPDHLKQFYSLLNALEERLGGPRQLSACTGHLTWPRRGVYFFMEHGEFRTDSGEGLRVVRVGTHALKSEALSTLWKRLRQHRGPMISGGGNHRGSIFRRIVGAALISRDSLDSQTWEEFPSSAPREIREAELPLEQHVSTVIRDMPFLWLSVADEPGPDSNRGLVERNAIALLSNCGTEPIDPPSSAWLGRYCNREKVRTSGLWNSNHVDEDYDPTFLDTLEVLVSQAQ